MGLGKETVDQACLLGVPSGMTVTHRNTDCSGSYPFMNEEWGLGGQAGQALWGCSELGADLGGQLGLALTCHLPEQTGTGDGPDRCG